MLSDLITRQDRDIHFLHVVTILATIMLIKALFFGGGGYFRKRANAAAEGLYLEVIEKQGS